MHTVDQEVGRMILRITSTLRKRLGMYAQQAARQHPMSGLLASAVAEFVLRPGAKRTRGLLVLIGYLSNSQRQLDEDILRIAAAYEVLHGYLLIHDDIIDEDIERRGKPTLHKLFTRLAPARLPKTYQAKIGRDIAIIAGDAAADLVQRFVLETSFSSRQQLSTLRQIEETLHTTYVGQVLDILALPGRLPRLSDQLLRYRLKTAQYSIAAPFLVGAALAGSRFNATAFRKFAEHAGIGFQLADDVANIFGEGAAARNSDIRSGKVTLLMTLALQSSRYRQPLLKLLKKTKRSPSDVRELQRLIRSSGGLTRAQQMISERYQRAEALVDHLGVSARGLALIRWLIARFRASVT
ncbi:MAG: polyprenyl synthetase family protein [Candidatus Kerfeldbacteria bacterium]|nr:polyprenyl synthetase family protein [Candidatus Kerfeldbacteria bacterium]